MDHDGLNFGNTPLNNQALEIEIYSNTISFSAEHISRFFFLVSILAHSPGIGFLGLHLYTSCIRLLSVCALSVKSPLDQLRPPQPQDWQDLENQEQPPGKLLAHSVGEIPTNHASRKPSFDLKHKTHLEIDINSGYLQSKICCRKHIPVTLVCFPMIKTVPRSM